MKTVPANQCPSPTIHTAANFSGSTINSGNSTNGADVYGPRRLILSRRGALLIVTCSP